MLVKFTITIHGIYKYNRAPNGTDLYIAEAGALRDGVYLPPFMK